MRRLRWDPTAFFKDGNGLFSRVHCNEMQQISEHGKLQLDTGKQFFFFFLAWQQSTIGAGTWKCCRNSILGHIRFNWLRCWTPAVIGPALNNSTWSPEVPSNPPDFFEPTEAAIVLVYFTEVVFLTLCPGFWEHSDIIALNMAHKSPMWHSKRIITWRQIRIYAKVW